MDIIKSLLESEGLDDKLKAKLEEEWNAKLEEARVSVREEVEVDIREEFARRFETDRAKMVEAMDKFMTDSITKELEEFHEDRRQVFEARAKLAKQIRENKESVAKTLSGASAVLEQFVLGKVKEELGEFMQDKKALAEQRKAMKVKLEEQQTQLNQITAERIGKLEKFITRKLSEEIQEFETDKHELVEQKVRMAREAKAKLDETRKNFVQRSARLVEQTLNESLQKEFTRFREDIKAARQNHFGRKIFESFAAEYMTSYLSEGSEVKKLSNMLEESKSQTAKALNTLKEQQNVIGGLNRKVQVTEGNAKRTKLMTELLSPLSRDNRSIMEEVLSNVKTERLREAFKKHLPSVLNENRGAARRKENLSEDRAVPSRRVVEKTGNKKTRVVTENRQLEQSAGDDNVVRLQKLAGIK